MFGLRLAIQMEYISICNCEEILYGRVMIYVNYVSSRWLWRAAAHLQQVCLCCMAGNMLMPSSDDWVCRDCETFRTVYLI